MDEGVGTDVEALGTGSYEYICGSRHWHRRRDLEDEFGAVACA